MTVINSHRVAIRTKYLGPTNYRGSRIRVWRADSTYAEDPHALTVGWEHALGISENHHAAVERYVTAADWNWPGGHWVCGGGREGTLAVWASVEEG